MTRYRFLDPMGDVVGEGEFAGHDDALAEAEFRNEDENNEDEDAQIQRVEFLGPHGDWRWAGPLRG